MSVDLATPATSTVHLAREKAMDLRVGAMFGVGGILPAAKPPPTADDCVRDLIQTYYDRLVKP